MCIFIDIEESGKIQLIIFPLCKKIEKLKYSLLPHGNHAGDFPVLFSNNGVARMCFFTNKFKVADIIGKAVVIHQNPDDYRTQPAGDSGKRLACGVIKENLQ